MRILQVCPYPYGTAGLGGGVSVHVQMISEHLSLKHDVTVYCTDPRNSFRRFEKLNGVKVERFRTFSPKCPRLSIFGKPQMSWELLLKMRKAEFDVVHAHSYYAFPMHFSFLAKRKQLVATTHFHGPGHSMLRDLALKMFKPVGKASLRKADRIIAVSAFEKSLLIHHFKVSPDKIVVIPNGVDLSEFRLSKRRDRLHKSILFVGNLEEYKGIRYLVEALPELSDEVVLEVVGKGELKALLERRAKELGVSSRVHFHQNLPREKLWQKYVDADLFALPSMYEAYSISVAEALAAQTPCIVANTSALSEWIDGITCFGLNVPVEVNELVGLIERILNMNISREAYETRIGTKILEWNVVAKKVESVYETGM